ncbi:MAG: hypothetical protein AAFQ92_08710 [Bacteroidota bacterium]
MNKSVYLLSIILLFSFTTGIVAQPAKDHNLRQIRMRTLSPDSSAFRVIPQKDSGLIYKNMLAVFQQFKSYLDKTTQLSYDAKTNYRNPNVIQRVQHIESPIFAAANDDGVVYLEDNLRKSTARTYNPNSSKPQAPSSTLPLWKYMGKYRTMIDRIILDSVTLHEPKVYKICFTAKELVGFISFKEAIHRSPGIGGISSVDTVDRIVYIQTSKYKDKYTYAIDRVKNYKGWRVPSLKEVTFSPEARNLIMVTPKDHYILNPYKPHKIEWKYNYSEDLVITITSLRKVFIEKVSPIVLQDTISSSRGEYWWIPKLSKDRIEAYAGQPAELRIQSIKDTNVESILTCFISAPFAIDDDKTGYNALTGGQTNTIKISWERQKWKQGNESPVEILDEDEIQIDLLDSKYRLIKTISDTTRFKEKRYKWKSAEVLKFYKDYGIKESKEAIIRVSLKKDPENLLAHSKPITIDPNRGNARKMREETIKADSIASMGKNAIETVGGESVKKPEHPETDDGDQLRKTPSSKDGVGHSDEGGDDSKKEKVKRRGFLRIFKKKKYGDLGTGGRLQ